MSKRKYSSLLEVAKAFQSGELDKNEYKLFVDSDYSHISWDGEVPSNLLEDSDVYWDYVAVKGEECGGWFRGNGYYDFLQALQIAKIPYEEA